MVLCKRCTAGSDSFSCLLFLFFSFHTNSQYSASFNGRWVDCVRARILFSCRASVEMRLDCEIGAVATKNCIWSETIIAISVKINQWLEYSLPNVQNPPASLHSFSPSLFPSRESLVTNTKHRFFHRFCFAHLLNNYCCFSSRSVHFGGFYFYFTLFVCSFVESLY